MSYSLPQWPSGQYHALWNFEFKYLAKYDCAIDKNSAIQVSYAVLEQHLVLFEI